MARTIRTRGVRPGILAWKAARQFGLGSTYLTDVIQGRINVVALGRPVELNALNLITPSGEIGAS